MYRRGPKGWLKHYDFIVIDLICLQIAFVASYMIRHGFTNPYAKSLYLNMAVFVELADLIIIIVMETFKNVLKRGYYQEFLKTVQNTFFLLVSATLYLFTLKEGANYSRYSLYSMAAIYALLSYVAHIVWKKHLQRKMVIGRGNSLLIITTDSIAEDVVESMKKNNFKMFRLAGVALVDCNRMGETITDVPIVACQNNVADYVCREWVDEVLLVIPPEMPYPECLMGQLLEMGVTVHLNLSKVSKIDGQKQSVERIGDYTVLTTSLAYTTNRQAFCKRVLDIVGGLIGCVMTAVIFLFVAPAIYISSPGPIFFSQVRVGKNGKKFKMYKFRSMYPDAEERKKELMEQNRVDDGMMFKMDFDPRVIGNKVLPNGKTKTGIGQFIRSTSLDEFPQFFNVLKGEMSLVGTRPPTEDEWEKYELHHRARLAIKPGITGLWQVSGRSDITSFEEVVRLDTQYISEWNVGLDLKILLKTVQVVLRKNGAK